LLSRSSPSPKLLLTKQQVLGLQLSCDVAAGYKVPKGSWFFISAYTIHNDPAVWGDDVATFLPERWLTDDPAAAKKAKNSFFGFGDGPRVCPGSRFALLEAKTALVRVFQKFTLELQPGQVRANTLPPPPHTQTHTAAV